MTNTSKIVAVLVGILVVGGGVYTTLHKEPITVLDQTTEVPPANLDLPTVSNSNITTDQPQQPCYVIADGKVSYNYGDQNILAGADATSFEDLVKFLGDIHNNSCYGKDAKKVYFRQRVVAKADPKTFIVLSDGYAKDKTLVYYHGETLSKIDPVTFQVLGRPFVKDKNNVYFVMPVEFGGASIVEGADPTTFQALVGLYAKDSKNVFASIGCGEDGCAPSSLLKDADVATFTAFNFNYAKDKNHVYSFSNPEADEDVSSSLLSQVALASPATFSVVGEYFGKDSSHVFYYNTIVTDADPQTFVGLDYRYGKDKNSVYYRTAKVPEADLATFIVKSFRPSNWSSWYSDAQDKNNFYQGGKAIAPPSE